MKNECEDWNFEIKVYMAKEEWEDLEEVYMEFDADGNVTTESVIKECVEEDWGYIQVMGCTFIVGQV